MTSIPLMWFPWRFSLLGYFFLVTESAYSLCVSIPAHIDSNHAVQGVFIYLFATSDAFLTSVFLRHLLCLVSRPVNSRLCPAEEPPSAVRRCSILCQRRCLLSQWSPWGACLHDSCNEPQGRRGTTWRTCGKRGGTNFLFNQLPEMSSWNKERRVLSDVAVADKHVTVSRSEKLSVSSKVLAAVWDSVKKKVAFLKGN